MPQKRGAKTTFFARFFNTLSSLVMVWNSFVTVATPLVMVGTPDALLGGSSKTNVAQKYCHSYSVANQASHLKTQSLQSKFNIGTAQISLSLNQLSVICEQSSVNLQQVKVLTCVRANWNFIMSYFFRVKNAKENTQDGNPQEGIPQEESISCLPAGPGSHAAWSSAGSFAGPPSRPCWCAWQHWQQVRNNQFVKSYSCHTGEKPLLVASPLCVIPNGGSSWSMTEYILTSFTGWRKQMGRGLKKMLLRRRRRGRVMWITTWRTGETWSIW